MLSLLLALAPTLYAQSGRLPRGVVPESYELGLSVAPDSGTFSGSETITVRAARPVKTVVMHAVGLTLRSASADGSPVSLDDVSSDTQSGTIAVRLPVPWSKGKHSLSFAWDGVLDRQMRGLYLSTAERGGRKEAYAFTQFEADDARRAFPCFDEPGLKAVFRLTASAPAGLTLVSNMPAASETEADGRRTVVFADTPRMPTYLLALAAARLTPTRGAAGRTSVTVWTLPEQAPQAAFALQVATESLTRLEAYFGAPYALPKLDLVAAPDFAHGGMENWGAVFFRDTEVLVDPAAASEAARRRVAMVVAHELAHQWFGDLVTMLWWDDIWLNEAFATWVSYKVLDDWRPEWRVWGDFEDWRRSALGLDALANTRPVKFPNLSPDRIMSMFDALTYAKGGAVLRMLEAYLGPEAFRDGVRRYVHAHAYGNAASADLWRALSAASGRPVGRVAGGWIERPGYPLVSVTAQSADGRRVRLSQRRFLADGGDAPGTWDVPVTLGYADEGGTRTMNVLLSAPAMTVSLPGRGTVRWIDPNRGQAGYYRAALDRGLLDRLLADGGEALPEGGRTALLGDLWAQAQAGRGTLVPWLDALAAFAGDMNRPVVEETADALVALQDGLAAQGDAPRLARLASELLGPRWRELGWDGPTDGDSLLKRAAVLGALGRFSADPAFLAEIDRRAERVLADPAAEPELAQVLLGLAARRGGADLYGRFMAALAGDPSPERRDILLGALSRFRDPALARRTAAWSLTEAVRSQNVGGLWRGLLRNADAQGAVWDALRADWPALRAKAGPWGTVTVVHGLIALQGPGRVAEVESFFKDPSRREPAAEAALSQALEAMALRERFFARARPVLGNWLTTRYPGPI